MGTKMYKVNFIVELLLECQEIGIDGYCGFAFNEKGNLEIILKEHEPDYPEAVQQVEILNHEGEY